MTYVIIRVAKANADKKIITKETVGAKLQDSIKSGKIPEDSWIVSLIGFAIKDVDDSKSGWVLVNFPNNSNQALLLEKELTGYGFLNNM